MLWKNDEKMPSVTKIHPLVNLGFHSLKSIGQWLDNIEIHNRELARFVCKLIPDQCPFEHDINVFGRTIAHIPPLCKLNPLYEQLMYLRFRALCYLVDECGETI